MRFPVPVFGFSEWRAAQTETICRQSPFAAYPAFAGTSLWFAGNAVPGDLPLTAAGWYHDGLGQALGFLVSALVLGLSAAVSHSALRGTGPCCRARHRLAIASIAVCGCWRCEALVVRNTKPRSGFCMTANGGHVQSDTFAHYE